MSFINSEADKFLTAHGLAGERAIIDKHDFSVKYNGKQFLVEDPIRAGKLTGKDLSKLLQDAVAARIAHEAGSATEQPADVTVAPAEQPVVTEPEAEPAGETPVTQPEPTEPAVEIAGDVGDIELDNTGKRERKPKVEKALREPKQNRYERSVLAILDNLSITAPELAKKASMSEAMAVYMIESYIGSMKALVARGIVSKNKAATIAYVKPTPKAKAKK